MDREAPGAAMIPHQTLSCLLFALSCSPTTYDHGVPNLAQVSDHIWRSGQPTTAEAWQYVKSLGVTHVLKLNFDGESSDILAERAGLVVAYIPIQPRGDKDVLNNLTNTFVEPDPVAIDSAERLLDSGGVWLVHCTHGQDRTGFVIGRFRVRKGWTKSAAYEEMLLHHFHPELHGLHEAWESAP